MSVPVPLDALAVQMAIYGPVAFVVTTSDDGRPHTVSARVDLVDGALRAPVGRTTATNAGARPSVTVLWPPSTDPRYSLIVDATASVEGTPGTDAVVVLTPSRAVQHRQADAGTDIPNCIPVEATEEPPTVG
jgi:hypothetical protein